MARSLREWRMERLIGLNELARAAGVQPKTIINIEHGRTQKIHMATMRKLADALGVEARKITEFRAALGLDASGEMAARGSEAARPTPA